MPRKPESVSLRFEKDRHCLQSLTDVDAVQERHDIERADDREDSPIALAHHASFLLAEHVKVGAACEPLFRVRLGMLGARLLLALIGVGDIRRTSATVGRSHSCKLHRRVLEHNRMSGEEWSISRPGLFWWPRRLVLSKRCERPGCACINSAEGLRAGAGVWFPISRNIPRNYANFQIPGNVNIKHGQSPQHGLVRHSTHLYPLGSGL